MIINPELSENSYFKDKLTTPTTNPADHYCAGTTALYASHEGKEVEPYLLVVQDIDRRSLVYSFPGGTSIANDTPLETLEREIAEEVGFSYYQPKLIHYDVSGDNVQEKYFFFLHNPSGSLHTVGRDLDISAPQYVPVIQLQVTIRPDHRAALHIIRQALASTDSP